MKNLDLDDAALLALAFAFDLAYDDQRNYLVCGDAEIDYGPEWDEVKRAKQGYFRMLGKVEDEMFSTASGNRWRNLADSLEEEA